MTDNKTLTVEQAAALKGVAANTLYRLLRNEARRRAARSFVKVS